MRLGVAGPTLELFAYLLTFNRRAVRRDYLADLLWENLDADRSRAALSTALWRLRGAIGKLPGVNLISDSAIVQLDLDETVVLDTERLKSTMSEAISGFSPETGLPDGLREALSAVLARCSSDFLEGASSNWALVEREEYFNLRLRGLAMLMQDAGLHARYEDALTYGRRILSVDPFREAVQCEMLWLYMLSGRRAVAIRQYRNYEAMLKRELGIAPMAETRAIYDEICADTAWTHGQARGPIAGAAAIPAPWRVLGEIERDRRSFYRSHFMPGA